jgi:hypothetical protein
VLPLIPFPLRIEIASFFQHFAQVELYLNEWHTKSLLQAENNLLWKKKGIDQEHCVLYHETTGLRDF